MKNFKHCSMGRPPEAVERFSSNEEGKILIEPIGIEIWPATFELLC